MIFLAGGKDANGNAQAAITANGDTAVNTWTKSASSGYSIVAAYGTWGGGTLTIKHQMQDGVSGSAVVLATLTSAAPSATLILPNGKYLATLTGATTPSLTIAIKPI